MGKALQFNHRMRISLLQAKGRFERLDSYLGKLADKGVDVAGVPFRLLDDLLALSVLENGQVSLRHETGGLVELLEKSILTAQAGSTQLLDIHRLNMDGAVTLSTDHDRLGQVFINLITNAQKYCDAEVPELVIAVEHDGADLSVSFADNGTPITDAARRVIFEKFARVGNQDGSGAGLGLAICREIMARLGGDISHLPKASGNTFVVHLPKQAALAAQ